jgi:hypothetical protein
MHSATLDRMGRALATRFTAAVLLALVSGCTSTAMDEGTSDASTSTLDGDDDGGADALGIELCVSAGGQCTSHSRAGGFFPDCVLVGPAQACDPQLSGGMGTLCCAVPEAGSCTEIGAGSYDQSCTMDSDCIEVGGGSTCGICALNCPQGAINVRALAQYMSDIANTTASISSSLPACQESCGLTPRPPCCLGGRCQLYGDCGLLPGVQGVTDASLDALIADSSPAEAAAANADAGAGSGAMDATGAGAE